MRTVIVGSGLAGVTLAEALARSAAHQVTLVTSETHGYYSRPRLSHGLSLDEAAAGRILLKRFDEFGPRVRLLPGTEAWLIERDRKRLVLRQGEALPYDVLVLATGSAARIPPALAASRPRFHTLNSLDDLLTLRRRHARGASRWAVIGGGLIGCEVASDLARAGCSVTIFHREARLIELQLTEPQSQRLHEHFAFHNVDIRYRQALSELPRGFDGIIVATGFAPRVELAREAGLATARGIVVDEYLRTGDPDIHAVGDVAEVGARLYPFVAPIRSQGLWLAEHLEGRAKGPWRAPAFRPAVKIHGFRLEEPAAAAAS